MLWKKKDYQLLLVNHAKALELQGVPKIESLAMVIKNNNHISLKGGKRASERTLRRWIDLFEKEGHDTFENKKRGEYEKFKDIKENVTKRFIELKKGDKYLSVPKVIRILEKENLIKKGEISRNTGWRISNYYNLPLCLRDQHKSKKIRFEFKHRMDMVICDGKHFRAGIKENKRVVISFLDDSTRMCLVTKVGPSEKSRVFLRGLYDLIRHYGIPRIIFLDNGSGFKNNEVQEICQKLKINMIHGTPRYPEGRGKIERFNRTIGNDFLRTFPCNPKIKPDIMFLENIIKKATEEYNHTIHSSLRKTPYEKWHEDDMELKFPYSPEKLQSLFSINLIRKVSEDNIVKHFSKSYEVPIDYSGRKIVLIENVITGELFFEHHKKYISLKEVNLELNADIKRQGKPHPEREKETDRNKNKISVLTSELEHNPCTMVDEDGNYFEREDI